MTTIRPNSGFNKSAAECRAIARDYEARGLTTLAQSWYNTAKRVDRNERKATR